MIKPLLAASAVIFGVLHVFGDETRRVEPVARTAPLDVELIKSSYLEPLKPAAVETAATRSGLSETDAIKQALEAGKLARETRTAPVLQGVAVPISEPVLAATTEAAEPAPSYWYVTGSRVNLRAGPGTSNAVVGQLGYGDEAEVLADRDGWYQIQTADGSVSGWIFGKFLGEQLPG